LTPTSGITSGSGDAARDADTLRAENLSKTFILPSVPGRSGGQRLFAVREVGLLLKRGRTTALVGESGCGKSTIARMIVGLESPTHGSVLLAGNDLAQKGARRRAWQDNVRIQMIFQDPYASLNPRWKVSSIIGEALRASGMTDRRQIRGEVLKALEKVGLPAGAADKYPHQFSGGQRQRISIARALSCSPQFLVCDEPTSALDVSVQAQILNLLADIQEKDRLALLLITHDLSVVNHMAHDVAVMYLGHLVESRDASALFAEPRHPYTRLLLETIPRADRPGHRPKPMAGEVPNPLEPPSGCPFHPRCSAVAERCRSEIPLPIAVAGGTVSCHAVEEGRL
jgi:peptide/nickel transport system ATP-binding protein